MKRIVVLHSGGLDSTVMYRMALEDVRNEVIPVYFDIGHEYAWKERNSLPPEVIVHDMSWFSAKSVSKDNNNANDIYIPGRNMLFITLAATKYLPDEIWIGALMGEIHEQATDKNLEFLYRQNELLNYVLSPFKKVKVVYPFVERRMGKLEVTRWAAMNGLQQEILNSSSCLSGEPGNCGRCIVCLRRAGILPQVGMKEYYNVDPWTASENKKIIAEILKAELENDNSHYDRYRREEIIPTLLNEVYPGKSIEEIYEIYSDEKYNENKENSEEIKNSLEKFFEENEDGNYFS